MDLGGRLGDLFDDEVFTGRPPKPGKSSHDKRRRLATVRRGASSPRENHLRGIGEKGEGIRQIRQRPESQGDEKGSEVPGMRRQAVARREGKDGVQTYVCPKCGKKSCDASGTWPGSRIWGNERDVELRQADQQPRFPEAGHLQGQHRRLHRRGQRRQSGSGGCPLLGIK